MARYTYRYIGDCWLLYNWHRPFRRFLSETDLLNWTAEHGIDAVDFTYSRRGH